MIDKNDQIDLEYLKKKHDLIKIKVRSRHTKYTYNCYFHYNIDFIGYSSISRYCCECVNGLRIIGCCLHVVEVVYYLSHARFLSKSIRLAE